jgi:hypothetical protein
MGFMDDVPQSTKVVFWCMGALYELKRLGVLKGGDHLNLTPKGICEWDQLDAEWQPNFMEIAETLVSLGCDFETYQLVVMFNDDREYFVKRAEELNELDLNNED